MNFASTKKKKKRTSSPKAAAVSQTPSITSTNTLVRRLPPELYQPIIQSIPPTDLHTLYNLCLTSKCIQYDAEKHLYARGVSQEHSEDVPLHIRFLRTITQDTTRAERLAGYVKEYCIDSIVHFEEDPLWSLLAAGLRRMVNLKSLDLRTFGGHPSGELLLGAPFRLRKLIWRNHSDEAHMRRILLEQTELVELGLDSQEQVFNLQNDDADDSWDGKPLYDVSACPKLEVLRGNRYTIEALLPGRNVTRLCWIPDLEDVTFGPLKPEQGMHEALARVKVFSLGGYFSRPSLELFVHSLREVEVLELLGLHPHEIPLLKQLKTLQEIVLSLSWGSGSLPVKVEGREEFVRELFASLPELVCVDIVHDWKKVAEIRYQRWRRGLFKDNEAGSDLGRDKTEIVSMFDVRSERFG
ncbi:hypothetical protein D9613_009631 [Agrocybe pediades]|uniref:F-box domain-containing protein n=1 Tax=Agrocybe pediades TaxID=84607 RepID=A0A8H4R566_9AGAR|nr:hypothetical protein D9613_009631 [Agrocybe pediades]